MRLEGIRRHRLSRLPLMMYKQAEVSTGLDVDPASIHDILVLT